MKLLNWLKRLKIYYNSKLSPRGQIKFHEIIDGFDESSLKSMESIMKWKFNLIERWEQPQPIQQTKNNSNQFFENGLIGLFWLLTGSAAPSGL